MMAFCRLTQFSHYTVLLPTEIIQNAQKFLAGISVVFPSIWGIPMSCFSSVTGYLGIDKTRAGEFTTFAVYCRHTSCLFLYFQ